MVVVKVILLVCVTLPANFFLSYTHFYERGFNFPGCFFIDDGNQQGIEVHLFQVFNGLHGEVRGFKFLGSFVHYTYGLAVVGRKTDLILRRRR